MARLVVAGLMLLGCCAASTDASFVCSSDDISSFPKSTCLVEACTDAILTQVGKELNATFNYMYMGAHFAQFTIDRPGIAKFMFEAAAEERSHAILMLKYLNTRGVTPNFSFSNTLEVSGFNTLDYKSALEMAIEMEIMVTRDIYSVVTDCVSDYHGADVFTNPILDEQHESIRKLQGALLAFKDQSRGHEGEGLQLAEYIFDRKMLNGEF